ncbi:MAG: dimethylamine monooxygenase subunit DmmA family protein [Paracoccus sp. (in: a-proteobacteria)]|uniref:dimethylamine monooxygenase subunit DmmA family protein n=1 Tax=Paracoccus sp. TaxID=267 RepID=UPI0026E017A0|nr:dimethylamine monooxygenase subunit DmmA family protein [Paracoccus sp. (in: a-proteobacteria)]MDO5622628.1 dimethylamine monooxygenase subunit DmmA family protein [Paracoccus sp. (in: a-proteobacteria)]
MSSLPPSSAFVSRPSYARLEPRPCSAALMICDDAGAGALSDLGRAAPDLMARAAVIHVTATPDAGLRNLARSYRASADLDATIDAALADARMGLQVFLAGSQGVIAQAQARLLAHGLSAGAIQAEHRGGPARRMQCVHCKTIAEDVTIDPYTCPGCGRSLFVRDHFSRRIGAYQGVCVDAETPGVIPEAVEICL